MKYVINDFSDSFPVSLLRNNKPFFEFNKIVCHSIPKGSLGPQERDLEKLGERDSRNGRDDKIIILIYIKHA